MENKITCLIFDFDGVIADTDLGRFKLLKRILKDYDTELSNSFSKKDLIGLSTKGFLKKYSTKLSLSEINEIITKRHEIFFANLSDYCIAFKNMAESIKYFNTKFELAIVTTNDITNVKILLEHLEVRNYFKWIIGREKTENKNLEKTYELIPDLLKKEISECIVVEDSDFGVLAAKKEGFYCVRFDPDNLHSNENENEKVASYDELKRLVDKIANYKNDM